MLDEPQLCFLYALAAMAPDGAGVECGVYKGGSLAVWSAAREDRGAIYAVDSWELPHWAKAKVEYHRMMKTYDIPAIELQIESWDAPHLISDEIAFCFIDAYHGDPQFPRDLAAWTPRIIPGGVIVFHDYGVSKPNVTVKQHVDKWHKEVRWHRLGVVGSAAAFMRPRGNSIGGQK